MTHTQVRNNLTVSILYNPTIIENFRLSTYINNLSTVNHYLIDDLFNMKYLYFTDSTKFKISTIESHSNLANLVVRQKNKDEDVVFFVDISGTDRVFVSKLLDQELCGIRKKRSKLSKLLKLIG